MFLYYENTGFHKVVYIQKLLKGLFLSMELQNSCEMKQFDVWKTPHTSELILLPCWVVLFGCG